MEASPVATTLQSNAKQPEEELCKIERKEEEPESASSKQVNSPDPTHEDDEDSSEDGSSTDRQDTETIEVKEEEGGPIRRGLRPRDKQKEPAPKPKPKSKSKANKNKKKKKRIMKDPEEDDPRNRGVPKSKKIRKRRNKPKPISDEAKREAQVKREEEEYQRKITSRGKKPVVKKLRGELKKKKERRKSQEDVKLEGSELKLQQSDEDLSEDSGEAKRRTSRKQKQRERDEDKRKVDRLMTARGERERREQIETLVRTQRMMAVKFGTKMKIEIDPACRYYSQYKCRKGEIEKSGKLYCQIYNRFPVPADARYFFQMKIARLSFQSVTVGLISARNFEEQYSRDKLQCICFDAYTHSTYVQGAKTDLQVEIKLNDVIRTVVDIPNATVHWYLNYDFISEAIVPPHMVATPLFPYLEVSNKWIKLRINDFQQ